MEYGLQGVESVRENGEAIAGACCRRHQLPASFNIDDVNILPPPQSGAVIRGTETGRVRAPAPLACKRPRSIRLKTCVICVTASLAFEIRTLAVTQRRDVASAGCRLASMLAITVVASKRAAHEPHCLGARHLRRSSLRRDGALGICDREDERHPDGGYSRHPLRAPRQ
jgi:hypothetical protein